MSLLLLNCLYFFYNNDIMSYFVYNFSKNKYKKIKYLYKDDTLLLIRQ